jgi:hypothetical protein
MAKKKELNEFERALAGKEADFSLEYRHRAARITRWVREENKVSDKQALELYIRLKDAIQEEEESFDSVALDILDEIKSEK